MNKNNNNFVSNDESSRNSDAGSASIGEEREVFLQQAEDEEVMKAGTEILEKHLKAFEELSK